MKIFFGRKLIFCFVILNLFQHLCIAQNKKIDSLLTLLKTAKEDTNKANILNKLSIEYRNISNYDSSLIYANRALRISNSFSNGEGRMEASKAYSGIGTAYSFQGNYTEALRNYFAALKIYTEIGNKKGIATSYSNIGAVYYSR